MSQAVNKKVRIVYIVNYFMLAGIENYVMTLLNNLDRDHFQPFLYVMYVFDKNFAKQLKSDVPVRMFSKKSGYNLNVFKKLLRQIAKDDIHVIHVNNWGTFLDGVLVKMFYRKVGLVHVQHGFEYDEKLNASGFKRQIRKMLRHLLIRYCDLVVSVSCAGKIYLKKEWGAKNVKVIYNGIDINRFSPEKISYAPDIRLNRDFNICTIGRLVPVKNFLCLFKAINLLKYKIPRIKLYHIGAESILDDNTNQELTIYLDKNQLTKHIKFLGQRDDLANILTSYHVFALTSFSEAISLALLESQSMGLPAVVTNVGGNPEIVQDGMNGFLVPSNDEKEVAKALFELYKDSALRKKMSWQARRIVNEKFSLVKMIQEYSAVYLQVVSSNRHKKIR